MTKFLSTAILLCSVAFVVAAVPINVEDFLEELAKRNSVSDIIN